ncbi:MAG: hypothetical protein QG652_1782 [Pseudomonadota bacterium]|nr:hypothetical protein [Pseudomonadota bacterium]
MAQVQQIFDDSGDAVFGIDQMKRITYMNAAFLQILGKPAEEMQGRSCHDVLCADDLASRRFCHSQCPVAREAMQNLPMQNFDLVLTRHDRERCWVNVGVYTLPESMTGPGQARIYFAMRTISGQRLIRQMANELHKSPATERPTLHLLTPREMEILTLTARGQDTTCICNDLSIAPQTVRNHFKNIFSKLKVNSRSQAIALALRQQLI